MNFFEICAEVRLPAAIYRILPVYTGAYRNKILWVIIDYDL